MQKAVVDLVGMGPLPSEDSQDVDLIKVYQNLLESVQQPISDEEAIALSSLFGKDDCYGLAWTLAHIIESSPSWPMKAALTNINGEWAKVLADRAGI